MTKNMKDNNINVEGLVNSAKKRASLKTKKLTKDLFDKLQIMTLQRQNLIKDSEILKLEADIKKMEIRLREFQVDKIRERISELDKDHSQLLIEIQDKIGIDIKNKSINPETLEIID